MTTGILSRVFNGLSEMVYPQHCIVCDAELIPGTQLLALCESCECNLDLIQSPKCTKCSKPFHQKNPGTKKQCSECRSGRRVFDMAVSFFSYSKTFRKVWHRIKFQNNPEWISNVVDRAIAELEPGSHFNPFAFDLYTWAPTSDERLKERGFDPAELIAEQLGRHFNRPVRQLIRRVKNTEAQFGLKFKDRKENLKGAFAAAPAFSGADTGQTRSVLLIDDILTTGSTANACTEILKKMGYKKVILLTLAR